jgi:hypothetical protein
VIVGRGSGFGGLVLTYFESMVDVVGNLLLAACFLLLRGDALRFLATFISMVI